MPNMNNLTEMPRKDLHVFYVLDTSGSMAGQKNPNAQ
jgi:Mg-chelatase subunit ChlD